MKSMPCGEPQGEEGAQGSKRRCVATDEDVKAHGKDGTTTTTTPATNTSSSSSSSSSVQKVDPEKIRACNRNVVPSGFVEDLIRCWRVESLSSSDRDVQDEILSRLNQASVKWIRRSNACLYGSRCTGIGCEPSSDLDVCIDFPGFDPKLAAEDPVACQKRLKKLSYCLSAKGFNWPMVVPCRGIELVKCTDKSSGLRVDITIGNAHAVKNSGLLREICEWVPEIAPVMWFLKRFAKRCGWLDAARGGFTSYCITTMLLCAAQRVEVRGSLICPVLPSPLTSAGLKAAFTAHEATKPEQVRPAVIASLLAGFLSMYHSASRHSIGPTVEGAILDSGEAAIYVADMLDGSNCARAVRPHIYVSAVHSLGEIVDALLSGSTQVTPLLTKAE